MTITDSEQLYDALRLPRPADRRSSPHSATAPAVDIAIPVFNEEATLDASVRRLRAYLDSSFPLSARITVVDNASTDATYRIGQQLTRELPGVRLIRLPDKGRGRGLRRAWSISDADVVAYMDVDLSTDLKGLLPLVAPLLSGHSDIAIGTRLAEGSRVVRGPKRELISRSYNAILRTVLAARFSDAQCGFKAIRADVARRLLPQVRDEAWFFDTELLVLAEREGLRIHEVPVDWTDDPDSRVDIVPTALADLRGVARMALRGRAVTEVVRFAGIGTASTLAYVALYAALRTTMSALLANALALLVTGVANTAANRRLTFDIRGRTGAMRHQLQGLAIFAVALGLTSGSLAALHALAGRPARAVEIAVLVLANLVATVVRFVLLRRVFRAGTRSRRASRHGSPTTRELLRGMRSMP
ncbi:MAG TPA: bifunctional glycosyltransferase family 2/GtrA family protein [Mycobacteriales bacterium]|nr:bifunctional glycosyltransferase family 2/GtrA family protein [Mycobacteriales bacterium]